MAKKEVIAQLIDELASGSTSTSKAADKVVEPVDHHANFLTSRGWTQTDSDKIVTHYETEPTQLGPKNQFHTLAVFKDGSWRHHDGQDYTGQGGHVWSLRKYLFARKLATREPTNVNRDDSSSKS